MTYATEVTQTPKGTLCCGNDPKAVYFNPYNQVVQCHSCGHVYEPKPSITEAEGDELDPTVNTRRAAVAGPREDALTLIAQERQRQISVEGYDANHDDGDGHDAGELAQAAAAYALGGGQITNIFEDRTIDIWPTSWGGEEDTIKRKPRLRQLVIAGALIVAEIERLQRSNGDTAATASPAPAESVKESVGHHLPNWLWCERCQAWIETAHQCGARYIDRGTYFELVEPAAPAQRETANGAGEGE